VDLNTCTYAQALAAEYLLGGYVPGQVNKIIELYRPKLEAMITAVEKYFPEGCEFTKPDGGMFLWVKGPKGIDMEDIYNITIEKKVGFVPGKFFYPNPADGIETMRLNFTNVSVEQIDKSIRIIGESINEVMEHQLTV